MKKGTVPTAEQILEFVAVVMKQLTQVVKLMTRERLQYWIGHQAQLGIQLRRILLESAPVNELLFEWQQFYKEVFGLEFDPTTVTLSDERDGFGWVIVSLPGLTDNQVYDMCASRFPSWRHYNNLDAAIVHNDRDAKNGPYAIRVRDGVEADQQYRNVSANKAIERGVKGLTVRKRMLQELWYHWKTGKHLDTKSGTICSGSRYADGGFACVYWHDDEFRVRSVDPVHANDYWGVRELVS